MAVMTSLSELESARVLRWRVAALGLAVSLALLAGGVAQTAVDLYIYQPVQGCIAYSPSGFESLCLRLHVILNLPPSLLLFGIGAALDQLPLPASVLSLLLYGTWLGLLILWWLVISRPLAISLPRRLGHEAPPPAPPGSPPSPLDASNRQ